MKKVVALLFVLASLATCQQTSNYQVLWTSVSGSVTFTQIKNIGQTSRQVIVSTSDTGGTCNATVSNIGSTDPGFATQIVISTATATAGTGVVTQITGNGLYPYEEVVVTDLSGHCTSSAWYVASKNLALPPYLTNAVIDFLVNGISKQASMNLDVNHDLVTYNIAGTSYVEFETNQTATVLRTTAATHTGYLGSVIIGTAGTGTSTVVIKDSGTNTIVNLDGTKTGVYPIGLQIGSGLGLNITTTGTVAPKVTVVFIQ